MNKAVKISGMLDNKMEAYKWNNIEHPVTPPQLISGATVEYNIPQQTFKLSRKDGAYLIAYLEGIVFSVFVPEAFRQRGIGTALLKDANSIIAANGGKMSFTSTVTPVGDKLVRSWKSGR